MIVNYACVLVVVVHVRRLIVAATVPQGSTAVGGVISEFAVLDIHLVPAVRILDGAAFVAAVIEELAILDADVVLGGRSRNGILTGADDDGLAGDCVAGGAPDRPVGAIRRIARVGIVAGSAHVDRGCRWIVTPAAAATTRNENQDA